MSWKLSRASSWAYTASTWTYIHSHGHALWVNTSLPSALKVPSVIFESSKLKLVHLYSLTPIGCISPRTVTWCHNQNEVLLWLYIYVRVWQWHHVRTFTFTSDRSRKFCCAFPEQLEKCSGKCSLCERYRTTWSIKELGYRKAIWFRKKATLPPSYWEM